MNATVSNASKVRPASAAKALRAVDIEFGRRIRLRRIQLGLSQSALAAELDVAYQQIQKYEKGINRISSGTLHTIASVLRVPVSELFPPADTTAASDAAPDVFALLTDDLAIKLLAAFAGIPEKQNRMAVVDLAKILQSTAAARTPPNDLDPSRPANGASAPGLSPGPMPPKTPPVHRSGGRR